MKKELTKGQNDYVNLLRAVMALSSALSNLDSVIHDKKYIKFKLKNAVEEWQTVINITTPDIMKAITEEDESLVVDIIMHMEALDESIICKREEKKSLMILYIKTVTALHYLELIEIPNIISESLKFYSDEVAKLIKSQYPSVVKVQDVEDKTDEYISLTKKIMYLKSEIDELGMVDKGVT